MRLRKQVALWRSKQCKILKARNYLLVMSYNLIFVLTKSFVLQARDEAKFTAKMEWNIE